MWDELGFMLAGSTVAMALLLTMAAAMTFHLVIGALALIESMQQSRRRQAGSPLSLIEGDLAPPISLLVVLGEGERGALERLRDLMRLRYPNFEIILVNDGRSDAAFREIVQSFELRDARRTRRASIPPGQLRGVWASPDFPFLLALDLQPVDRATALNVALAYARHPLFLAPPPGALLERDTLLQLVQPFYEDATVLVATGSLRPSNGCAMRGGTVVAAGSPANLLARLQIIDQLGRALSARLAWSLTDSLFLAPESLPLMAREVAVAVGGYRRDTPDPDADLVLRIQHWAGIQGRQMAVRDLSGAGAWVPVPETLTAVARHRARSHEHLVRTLWLNRGILRTLFTKPGKALDFLLQCAIEVLGPLAELVGLLLVLWLYATGHVDALIAMLFLSLIVIDGTLSGLLGLLMERVGAPRLRRTRDIEALAFTALLANLGWRQLDALWRLTGLCAAAVPRREPAQPALPESASPPPATLRTERRAA